MFRVLVSDFVSDKGIALLEKEVEVYYNHKLSREEFLNIIGDYDAIIVRSMTQLDQEALEKAKKLKVIGRAGTGYDNINLKEASKRGIIVFNTPTGNTISASEHTIAMIMALSRNIPQANQAMHQCIWDRKKYKGIELKDKTLGIIGLGRIGSRVARYAQSLNMKVIANDPYLPVEKAESINVPLLSLNELLQNSDFITLHTPLTDETFHILSHKEFAMMKDNVRIINVARGKNLDTLALASALESGKVAGAAIDVHEEEPITPDNPLLKSGDKVIMTCHLGGTTIEALDNVSITAAEEVLAVLKNELPVSPLNIFSIDAQEFNKLKPYLELINRLGKFLAQWNGHERIKKIEVEYGGEPTKYNSKALTTSLLKDILDPILDNRVNLVNAYLVAKEREIVVRESFINQPNGLSNIIKVNITTDRGIYSIAGTSLPIGFRIIEINGYRVDLKLEGKFLLTIYQDKPGIIGKTCTFLGDDNVNIGNMQVGRKDKEGQAIMIIQADSRPETKTLARIKEEPDFYDVSYIQI